ncbi:MAG: DUF4129 domain-containing protein, partial [Anaerolineae bacterium]|nr:DUF4129 domain-containing protein [Anaerolineae bacterium]
NPWADNFFRPLLITVMIMCFNLSLVNLVRMVNPAWRGTYFLLGMLLTTVEGLYSYRVLKHLRSRGVSVLRYRLAEGAILILLLRLLSWAGTPLAEIWLQLQAMWQDPGRFVDFEFYVLLILGLIAWGAATNTMADFEELHDPYTFRSDRIFPLDNLATRFFWGGAALVLISGVTQWIARSGLRSLIDFQRPSLGGVILNVLVYFTIGLVLLSQAHLTTLLVRWQVQKIKVSGDLVRQWAKYGFIFLGFVMGGVFLLPTGYTLGFLASAGITIRFLLGILTYLIELLLVLLSLPFLWFLSLLGQSPDALPPPSTVPPVFPEGPAQGAPVPWLEVIRSLIFWLIALAIIIYLIKIYFNDHPELGRAVRSFKPLGHLLKLLAYLWRQLLGLAQAGMELVPKRLRPTTQAPATTPAPQRWSWLRLRNAPPRQRILYYYLNILQRAAKTGAVRRTHQTPYEYESDLNQTLPETQMEVNALTKAFVRARYSQEPFNDAQAEVAKTLWQRIRDRLRHVSKGAVASDTTTSTKND